MLRVALFLLWFGLPPAPQDEAATIIIESPATEHRYIKLQCLSEHRTVLVNKERYCLVHGYEGRELSNAMERERMYLHGECNCIGINVHAGEYVILLALPTFECVKSNVRKLT